MRFDLTDDQKAIREMLSSFLADKVDDVRALQMSDAGDLDKDLWNALCELGLNAVMVSEASDGLGMDLLTLAMIAEEFGTAAASAPVVSNALAAWLIDQHGNAAQKEKYLSGLISGDAIAAFAISEGSEYQPPEAWTLTASATGTKTSVEWGERADVLIVGLADGKLGLVAREARGLSINPLDPLDRTRPIADLHFENVEFDILSDEPSVAHKLINALIVTLAADAYGCGSKALQRSVDYAKERVQYGQLIGSFQGLKHQLANMAVDMEPSRSLYWYAAHAWDEVPEESAHAAALAKAHIGSIAVKTARMAVECHGGIGYTWEFPLHLWLKRAMYDNTAFGNAAIHYSRASDLAAW